MPSPDHHSPDDFPPDLKPFEAALAGLVPAGSRIDRDRLMYLAGAAAASGANPALARHLLTSLASATRRLPAMLWPCATAALLLVSLGLGALVALRPPQEQIVYVDRPAANSNQAVSPILAGQIPNIDAAAASPAASASASYLVLRDHVLRLGVDALAPPRRADGAADHTDVRNRALLNELLGS